MKAIELVNEKANNALVLEDSQLGIEAAYNAGIDVICVPDFVIPDNKHKKMCLKVYDSLYDVLDYLKILSAKILDK